jgi:hypothetical protein
MVKNFSRGRGKIDTRIIGSFNDYRYFFSIAQLFGLQVIQAKRLAQALIRSDACGRRAVGQEGFGKSSLGARCILRRAFGGVAGVARPRGHQGLPPQQNKPITKRKDKEHKQHQLRTSSANTKPGNNKTKTTTHNNPPPPNKPSTKRKDKNTNSTTTNKQDQHKTNKQQKEEEEEEGEEEGEEEE